MSVTYSMVCKMAQKPAQAKECNNEGNETCYLVVSFYHFVDACQDFTCETINTMWSNRETDSHQCKQHTNKPTREDTSMRIVCVLHVWDLCAWSVRRHCTVQLITNVYIFSFSHTEPQKICLSIPSPLGKELHCNVAFQRRDNLHFEKYIFEEQAPRSRDSSRLQHNINKTWTSAL